MVAFTLQTPLAERIDNYLAHFPEATRIPIHPDDAKEALALSDEGNEGFIHGLPIRVLGHNTEGEVYV